MGLRLPRALTGGLVGMCLALAGCILQAVMKNQLASPSTIGVTSGASFCGLSMPGRLPFFSRPFTPFYFFWAHSSQLLSFIHLLAKGGASSSQIILSGLAVSALFGAFPI